MTRATFRGGLLNAAKGSGERCKLRPQQGLVWSPSRNRIWCNLVSKSDSWWQQFIDFVENQLTRVPENISFQKIWDQNTMFDPPCKFMGVI